MQNQEAGQLKNIYIYIYMLFTFLLFPNQIGEKYNKILEIENCKMYLYDISE